MNKRSLFGLTLALCGLFATQAMSGTLGDLKVYAAGYMNTQWKVNQPSDIMVVAYINAPGNPVSVTPGTGIELYSGGVSTGIVLFDDGLNGDAIAGDGLYTFFLPGYSFNARQQFQFDIVIGSNTDTSPAWPYLPVTDDDPTPNTPISTFTVPPTISPTPIPTFTPTPGGPTETPVPPTNTPVPPTNTPEPTNTPVPPTNTPEPSNTPLPTFTPVPTDTATPFPTGEPTWTPAGTFTATPTPVPTDTPTPTPEPQPTSIWPDWCPFFTVATGTELMNHTNALWTFRDVYVSQVEGGQDLVDTFYLIGKELPGMLVQNPELAQEALEAGSPFTHAVSQWVKQQQGTAIQGPALVITDADYQAVRQVLTKIRTLASPDLQSRIDSSLGVMEQIQAPSVGQAFQKFYQVQ